MCQVVGGLNDQPHDDHDPGEAEDSELDTQLEGKGKQISPYDILRFSNNFVYSHIYKTKQDIQLFFEISEVFDGI